MTPSDKKVSNFDEVAEECFRRLKQNPDMTSRQVDENEAELGLHGDGFRKNCVKVGRREYPKLRIRGFGDLRKKLQKLAKTKPTKLTPTKPKVEPEKKPLPKKKPKKKLTKPEEPTPKEPVPKRKYPIPAEDVLILPPKVTLETKKAKKTDPRQFFELDKNTGKIKAFVPRWLADEILKTERFFATSPKSKIGHYREEKGTWKYNGEAIIQGRARKLLKDLSTKLRINETVHDIRERNYIDPTLLEPAPNFIVVQNGVLNTFSRTLSPFDPEMYALNALPVKYDASADCPHIKQFLKEVCPEDIPTLQEWIGYHLERDYKYQKALMLRGEGANGKSTFLSLLTTFLGEDNVSNATLHELVYSQFSKADLYGKIANIAPDITGSELKYTGTFKALTGRDKIRAEFKHRDPFHFINYAKLSFSANVLPPSRDHSMAFFRRWLHIKFPNIFENEDCDPNLLAKLSTPEELSGLLNYALEGLARLRNRKEFTKSPTTEELEAEYIFLSDPIGAFIKQCLRIDSTLAQPYEDVYKAYDNYCTAKKVVSVDKGKFTITLRAKLQTIKKTRAGQRGAQIWQWEGIQLNEIGNKYYLMTFE